jgi:hypothetical protein
MQQLESLPAMISGVYSEDPSTQLEATTQFRKLLSIGMVPIFFKVLSRIYPTYSSRSMFGKFLGFPVVLLATSLVTSPWELCVSVQNGALLLRR